MPGFMPPEVQNPEDQVLFRDKLEKANEMLKTIGLPKSRKHS